MSRAVLLIEPDKVLGETYRAALSHANFSVQTAQTAQMAIHKVDTNIPDITVLELQLAAHNGVEFLYELRSYPEWQNIPVVILSQISQHEAGIDKKMAKKLGIAHYCYKPQTSLKKLIEIIEAELARV